MAAGYRSENGCKYALIFGNEVKGVQQEIVDMSDEGRRDSAIWDQALFEYIGFCGSRLMGIC